MREQLWCIACAEGVHVDSSHAVENGFRFCHFCGKGIQLTPATESFLDRFLPKPAPVTAQCKAEKQHEQFTVYCLESRGHAGPHVNGNLAWETAPVTAEALTCEHHIVPHRDGGRFCAFCLKRWEDKPSSPEAAPSIQPADPERMGIFDLPVADVERIDNLLAVAPPVQETAPAAQGGEELATARRWHMAFNAAKPTAGQGAAPPDFDQLAIDVASRAGSSDILPYIKEALRKVWTDALRPVDVAVENQRVLLAALTDAAQTARNYHMLFHDETWNERRVRWEAAIASALDAANRQCRHGHRHATPEGARVCGMEPERVHLHSSQVTGQSASLPPASLEPRTAPLAEGPGAQDIRESDIYAAIIKHCEEMERERSYCGNGHHLAQRLAAMVHQALTAPSSPGPSPERAR